MSCAIDCVRWLLFIFNFIFSLCGLALIIPAALFHWNIQNVPENLRDEGSVLLIGIIVIGSIVFVIAFFGCCGAIRESHCMVITFAVLLLTLLVIQVGIAIAAFVKIKGFDRGSFDSAYEKEFNKYWSSESSKGIVDFTQRALSCCGVQGPGDFSPDHAGMNGTIPETCCPYDKENTSGICHETQKIYTNGCSNQLFIFFKQAGKILGGIALGIAGVELAGIIFALCLANSIRNADRRAYRV